MNNNETEKISCELCGHISDSVRESVVHGLEKHQEEMLNNPNIRKAMIESGFISVG